MEHGVPGTRHPGVGRGRQAGGRRAAAIPVAAGLGAHQPNRRLRLAAEPQTGRREVSALTDARKTLAYDFFRILRAPLSDQYSGFHGIVVPGTLRDSIFVLEGLLEQQTGLNPVEIMTDTAGSSDIIFGLFWLLGYQFSPRLADAGEAVFWRVNKSANYGVLDKLARGYADLSKAESQWDEMMRAAGSLKLGTIHASELIRSLLKSSRPSGLAQAIMEVGRVNKTLYLLNYIDDEDYRRRILTQLNRGEGRHAVARAICYGQRGEIRKRYREGQEDQLGALGLVTNAVVLWNTLYMQEVLSWMRRNGEEIIDEDIARLSPLMHGHINMLGHYTFTLPEDILKGELRALNLNINNELSP